MIDHIIEEDNKLTISSLIFCGLRRLAELSIKGEDEFSLASNRKNKPMICIQADFEKKRFSIILFYHTRFRNVQYNNFG